jgi:exodeoxyribonuclease V beta subunit
MTPATTIPPITSEPFDLVGPIPPGRLAIEASAGTGKTFALAALATRFIAELDISASELLIVTFTRAATSELRARVRQQLVDAAVGLGSPEPPSPDNVLVDHLYGTDPAERRRRLDRVEQAITDFDAATITTIHGFATQVLSTLGTSAGTDLEATLVDDTSDLAAEVCADVLAAAAVEGHSAADLPKYAELVTATKIRLNTPDLVVVPSLDQPHADPKWRLLAELVRRSVETMGDRRRRAGTLSFDDILVELRRGLQGPGRATVIEMLRNRFRVALIDEFQDTDPVQWSIFSTLFGSPESGTTLVLVGDPKQAIYSFRGANIHTFTEAVAPRPGLENRSLSTNWRSDGALLTALNTLLDGATFGDQQISYFPVDPAPAHRTTRLADRRGGTFSPLSLRLALGPDLARNAKKPHDLSMSSVERAIGLDQVAQIRDLLDHGLLPADPSQPDGGRPTPLRPSDIAVLVRTRAEAATFQKALLDQGVPAVLARGGSVLTSPAAQQWRWLLEGLLRPSDPGRARTVALSWFCGLSPRQIEALDDIGLGQIQEQLRAWVDTLTTHGVNSLVRRVWSDSGVSARVLAQPDGDRRLTDLDHLAELMQTATSTGYASVARLLAVLDLDPVPDSEAEADNDVAARRIESEQQAVQIMTVWVAKGLEFPIVCVPTMWRNRQNDVIYQDPDTHQRTFDVAKGKGWPDQDSAAERTNRAAAEALGENLRMLYVALTRAKHHTVVWWTRGQASDKSGLARVLFARTDGFIDPEAYSAERVVLPPDDEVLDALAPLLNRAEGTIVASMHGQPAGRPAPWVDPATTIERPSLGLAHLGRVPDRHRHRWSFTAITNHDARHHVDPHDPSLGDGGADDEQDLETTVDEQDIESITTSPANVPPPAMAPCPMALLPAGADFGTLVHSVLEQVDFTADDLDHQLGVHIDDERGWRSLDLTPVGLHDATAAVGRDLLITGLRAAINTPLGPLFDGLRLRDLAPGDRLDEMSFDLRLGDAGHRATDRDIGLLVLHHLASAAPDEPSDPLVEWAGDLAGGAFSVDLAGHLTGSIDAVLRVGPADGPPRFVIVDYKTNRLNHRGLPPAPGDYRRDGLARSMVDHHYPLQALLYSVALHRYLRWRLPGYDPAANLGGAAYLFVRGMTGADVTVTDGHPDGVYSWTVPPALVTDLSDLLDGQDLTRASDEVTP